ncbi:MAG: SH3 domain-containing protein, partial [Chloroflexi bacterium]|nr:SH3 domain-containing protein [Chloroflexota bacterium]
QLPSGSPVTLMEGPINADGLVWWRIQTADGRSGWCIEGIVDGGVYIQTLVPAP